MSVCSKCNTTNKDDAKFCVKCGNPLTPTPLEEPKVPAADESVATVSVPVQATAPVEVSAPVQVAPSKPAKAKKEKPVKESTGGASKVIIGILSGILVTLIAMIGIYFGFFYEKGSKEDKKPVREDKEPIVTSTVSTPSVEVSVPDVSPNAEDIKDVTVLIYMIGANLDRDARAASDDVEEILKASISDNINIVIEAGGTTTWRSNYFTDGEVDRVIIDRTGLHNVSHLGKVCMSMPDTLTDFIKWGTENYPAEKYHLIMWDHGGGVVAGFGDDENFPDSSGLYISDIANAIADSNIHFDLIGFNACLMATVENANALSPYADYLLASEESIYANVGFNYTTYINVLTGDSKASTYEVGRAICDSFMYHESLNDVTDFDCATISLIDLKEVPELVNALGSYFGEVRKLIKTEKGYKEVINALINCKSYGDNEFDEVDLHDFISKITSVSTENKKKVMEAFYHCIAYRPDMSSDGSSGLSIYIPYNWAYCLGLVFSDELKKEGIINPDYIGFIDEFGQILASLGENTESEDAGTVEMVKEATDPFWSCYEAICAFEDGGPQLAKGYPINVYDGYIYLNETDIQDIQGVYDINKEMFISLECGFLLGLGYSPDFYFTDDSSIIELDLTTNWYTLNGNPVQYHYWKDVPMDDGTTWRAGLIPALVNGYIEAYLIAATDENGNSTIVGYYDLQDTSKALSFVAGDTINLEYDIYTYDTDYYNTEVDYDNTYVMQSDEAVLLYEDIEEGIDLIAFFKIDDKMGNSYYTSTFYCGDSFDAYAEDSTIDIIATYREIISTVCDGLDTLLYSFAETTDDEVLVDEISRKIALSQNLVEYYASLDFSTMSLRDAEIYLYFELQLLNGLYEVYEQLTGEPQDFWKENGLEFTFLS